MKPHRFSEMLGRLVEAILPGASAGRQREEFAQVVYDYIQPEHGNRGEEIEALVLVRAEELAALNDIADIARPRCRKLDAAALLDATRRLDILRTKAEGSPL